MSRINVQKDKSSRELISKAKQAIKVTPAENVEKTPVKNEETKTDKKITPNQAPKKLDKGKTFGDKEEAAL